MSISVVFQKCLRVLEDLDGGPTILDGEQIVVNNIVLLVTQRDGSTDQIAFRSLVLRSTAFRGMGAIRF